MFTASLLFIFCGLTAPAQMNLSGSPTYLGHQLGFYAAHPSNPDPIPMLHPQSIDITIGQGQSPAPVQLLLSNVGAEATMPFQAYVRPVRNNGLPMNFGLVSWMWVTPSNGTVIGNNTATLTLDFNTSNLGPGTYQSSLVVQSGDEKTYVSVTVRVEPLTSVK